ncbi:MAG: T9SS type A sorting domain-containing protein [Bacteroidetes bacterium]|nr:T9SS type A sorting domain-containing protein [Bacteroidota bacterium]
MLFLIWLFVITLSTGTNDEIFVKYNIAEKNTSILLFDVFGRKLSTQQINNKFTKIDLSGYSSGIYFLLIKSSNQSFSKSFIKY